MDEKKRKNFEQELSALINRYSIENQSDTPDFILAQYVLASLHAWNETTRRRDAWYQFPTVNSRVHTPYPAEKYHGQRAPATSDTYHCLDNDNRVRLHMDEGELDEFHFADVRQEGWLVIGLPDIQRILADVGYTIVKQEGEPHGTTNTIDE